ncbi:MAG TPA: glycosyltransferase [Clostridiaceae bacterium]|jgi:hypothetical protein|nr:glycosyltransferase [Clostridiaceae bacterium]
MIDFILNCILWTLALYGFWDILKIIKSTLKNRRIESNGIFVIVAVKNQEHQIEGFLRSVIFRILYGKEEYLKKIIVTDLDSVDNTKSILEKFSNDYSEIKLVDWEACKKQLDSLE